MEIPIGTDIENELHCSAPQAIRIKHKQQAAGCCHPSVNCLIGACLCPVLKRRSFNWIGENAILKNKPCFFLCTPSCNCCTTVDCTTMQLLSSDQFQPFCGTCGSPCGPRGFATQDDMCYCLFCIPCGFLHNLFVRPLCGETLWITPCENGTCGFLFGTRCCTCCTFPMDTCMSDSKTYRSILIQQIASTRKVGLTPAQVQTAQAAPPTVQVIVRS